MAVDNVVLDPLSATEGWKPRRRFANEITETRSGAEQRVQRWLVPKRVYEIPYANMPPSTYPSFLNFYELRGGSARPFLLWDATACFAANQPIGTGDGAATHFQLSVTISDAANSLTRNVLHPVPTGTAVPANLQGWNPGVANSFIHVYVDGVLKTEGVDYTVAAGTGIVTMTAAPAVAKPVTATFWYYTVVRFDGDDLELSLDGILASSNPNLVEVPFE